MANDVNDNLDMDCVKQNDEPNPGDMLLVTGDGRPTWHIAAHVPQAQTEREGLVVVCLSTGNHMYWHDLNKSSCVWEVDRKTDVSIDLRF